MLIPAPFSPMVRRKIDEVLGMNLPIDDMICPSHGLIWRDHPEQIVEQYRKWADNYRKPGQHRLRHDVEFHRRMAETIAEGLKEADPGVTVAFQRIEERQDRYRHRGIPLRDRHGSTVNNGYLYAIWSWS